jgi:hypothetical protein
MRTRAYFLVLAISLAVLATTPAHAQSASEAEVKAAFLPRFARYVTWPSAASPKGAEPFLLCVIGSDPFGRVLDEAAGSQSVDGRRIVVKRITSADAINGCHLAFIEGGKTQPVGQALAAIGRKPVLTVTDASSGGQRGLIHFTNANGRVRFFIDQAGARQRGLTISSRLLALAVGVRQ